MQKRKHIYSILLVLLLSAVAGVKAQSIEFSAKPSKQVVAADEAFRLVYSANVEADFTAPDLKDFKLLSGPSASTSSQITIINGQMKNSYSVNWVLIVRPKKEGEYTIPPAAITYKGKAYKSNSIKITVTAASANANQTDTESGQTQVKSNNKNMFCVIAANKTKVYKGEPVQLVYKLYSRYTEIQDYDINLGTQKDVWTQELKADKQGWPSYQETVNGMRYVVFPIRKEVVFPQKSGKLKLEPFDMMAVVRVNFFESQRFDLVSNSPVIDVDALPENAPAAFTNAVGTFSFNATINKEEVNVNDGVDITVTLKGSGNIKLVEPKKLDFPADFEVYDPEVNDKTTVTANGMSGVKEYKYLVIPRHSGDYKIAPIEFAYFDVETKNYITLSSPEFNIKVNKAVGEETPQNGIVSNKNEVEILDKDVRYLKPITTLNKEQAFFTGSFMYWAGLGVPPALFLLFLLVLKRKQKNYDPVTSREKQANKQVNKQLVKAQELLRNNNTAEFYTELTKGIQTYYCDRFNQQVVDFNKTRIPEVFAQKGISSNTTQQFLSLVENIEMARYASFMQGNETKLYADANTLINQIETEVKA